MAIVFENRKNVFQFNSREKDDLRDNFLETICEIGSMADVNNQFIVEWVATKAELYNPIVTRTVRILELMAAGPKDEDGKSMLNVTYKWKDGFNPFFKHKCYVEEFITKFIPVTVGYFNQEISIFTVACDIVGYIKNNWYEGYYDVDEYNEEHLSQYMF